ncbi:hypothetical protein C0993_010165 [Termitomyces sp. T159_Od127]|nr:hypothetical protein C0993_010165 [Termitomyces sp. T159_Od127]
MEVARAVAPVVAHPGPAVALTTPVLPAQPPAALAQAAPIESRVPDAPLAELSLEQRDEEMSDVPLDWDEMAWLDFEVVMVATDPRTPAQYDGLMAEAAKTSAASKGKTKAIPMEEDASDYGQSSKEEEEEEEEGETPAQRFQHVQRNKKLAKKKANRAEAAAALARRVQNDFSGRIPNGLGP